MMHLPAMLGSLGLLLLPPSHRYPMYLYVSAAQYTLGRMNADCDGLKGCPGETISWMRKAAEQGGKYAMEGIID